MCTLLRSMSFERVTSVSLWKRETWDVATRVALDPSPPPPVLFDLVEAFFAVVLRGADMIVLDSQGERMFSTSIIGKRAVERHNRNR